MKIYRFNEKTKIKETSKRPVVVVLSPDVSDEKAESIAKNFPNALKISECFIGQPPREGFFNVLRVKAKDLETLDFDKTAYKALLVEETPTMFYAELLAYGALAERQGYPRIEFVSVAILSERAVIILLLCANALRDYAAEAGITGIAPTIKQEVLQGIHFVYVLRPENSYHFWSFAYYTINPFKIWLNNDSENISDFENNYCFYSMWLYNSISKSYKQSLSID